MEKTHTITNNTTAIKRNIQVPPKKEVDGFQKITMCSSCKRTAAHGDQYVSDPCPNCGGKVNFVEKGGIFHKERGVWLVPKR
jgi:DNA-directed RNA polymerase subunit RPC12/RpoP